MLVEFGTLFTDLNFNRRSHEIFQSFFFYPFVDQNVIMFLIFVDRAEKQSQSRRLEDSGSQDESTVANRSRASYQRSRICEAGNWHCWTELSWERDFFLMSMLFCPFPTVFRPCFTFLSSIPRRPLCVFWFSEFFSRISKFPRASQLHLLSWPFVFTLFDFYSLSVGIKFKFQMHCPFIWHSFGTVNS